MEKSIKTIKGTFLIINNIPKDFHASHLRNFFSSFIESGGFVCFHFRHRPEVQKPLESDNPETNEKSRRVTKCCIIKVLRNRVKELIASYHGEHWIDCKGETLNARCFIKKISVTASHNNEHTESVLFKKGMVASNLPLDQENFSQDDLESLIELNPPSIMPNGNVGTKTEHFLNEIKACRLPPSLISKLGLQFPRNRSKKIYASVPFDYVIKRRRNYPEAPKHETSHKTPWRSQSKIDTSSPFEEDKDEEESEEEEEEWDRHEALHDDVPGQERNKERLFEEKIELKWEKGGSGLVFYTDAQFWDQKEGDFDAKTSDDWDIDTRIYTNPGMDNDKDMRDLVRMKLEEKLRNGTETEDDRAYDFAAFEKYSTGFGRKVLESQGWKQGQGVGRNAAGIAEPIPNDGQLPFDKKGFGYRGEKLCRHPEKRRKRKCRDEDDEESFFISTIYDKPEVSDPPESVLSSSFAKLKYRQEFLKSHEADS